MLYYERRLKKRGCDFIIGVDEAGRGPLAGPVVAAAVILKNTSFKSRIDDSKKLTPYQREKAFYEIMGKSVFGFGIINEKIIDRINILAATHQAMKAAILALVDKLGKSHRKNIHVIVDGNMSLDIDLPFTAIVKGDSKSKTIACASILAKVMRDRIMSLYDKMYPEYEFLQHKGYPTKRHRLLIKKFGPCVIHRKSFLACIGRI